MLNCLSAQICPWDRLACCWDVKQPTNSYMKILLKIVIFGRTFVWTYGFQHVSLSLSLHLQASSNLVEHDHFVLLLGHFSLPFRLGSMAAMVLGLCFDPKLSIKYKFTDQQGLVNLLHSTCKVPFWLCVCWVKCRPSFFSSTLPDFLFINV